MNAKDTDHDMWNALHYAVNEGHGDIAQTLIEKNIDVSAVTSN